MVNVRVALLQSFWTVPKFRSFGEIVRQLSAIVALSDTIPSGFPGLLTLNATWPVTGVTLAGTVPCGHARTATVSDVPGWSSLSNCGPAGSEKIAFVGVFRSRFEIR